MGVVETDDREEIRAAIAESEEERGGGEPDGWCPECRELCATEFEDGTLYYVCPDCGKAYHEDDPELLDFEPEDEDEEDEEDV